MESNLEQRMKKYAKKNSRKKIWLKILSVLSAAVVFCTTYALILPAITQERETFCGTEEHTHSESCLGAEEKVLLCELTEEEAHFHSEECFEKVLICETEEGHLHSEECYSGEELICEKPEEHIHSEECYETTLVCEVPETEGHSHGEECYEIKTVSCELLEHSHSLECYSDKNADIETEEQWNASFAFEDLGEVVSENLITIAKSQLGYHESTKNYIVLEDGETIKGRTRYGEWFEEPYADWNILFAGFCLEYSKAEIPFDADVEKWIEILSLPETDIFRKAGEHEALAGDLIFFDEDRNGKPDIAGIVIEITEDGYKTVIGDYGDSVQAVPYEKADETIFGFAEIAIPSPYHCGLEEHIHDNCFDENGNLICGFEEHMHSESCLTEKTEETAPEYFCGIDEHAHTEECFDEGGNLICETGEHAHTEECLTEKTEETAPEYFCGIDEHAHTEECFDEGGNLICETGEHAHTEECLTEKTEETAPEYFCGIDEHAHTEECFDEGGNLICETEEHSHTEECKLRFEDLPEEERLRIETVISMIEALPTADEIDAKIMEFEEAEDYEGEEAWLTEIYQQVGMAYKYYMDLPENHRKFVTNSEKLMELEYIWSMAVLIETEIGKTAEYSAGMFTSSGQYIIYTQGADGYYAISGSGAAVPINITADGVITANISDKNEILWTFGGSGNEFTIRNVSSGRYLHSYSNNGTGVTTSGEYTSFIEEISGGVKIRSNTADYAMLDEENKTFRQTQNLSEAAVYNFGTNSTGEEVYVWLDGTWGGLEYLSGSENSVHTVVKGGKIILPEEWKTPDSYRYKVRGWYDIIAEKYYPTGAEVTVEESTVFYPDWIPYSYDIGQYNAEASNTVSTSEFVTTKVFDYSPFYNLPYSSANVNVSASGHSETWTLDETNKLIFRDWNPGELSSPNNGTSGVNGYTESDANQGLWNADVENLIFGTGNSFDPATGTGVMGKTYLGTGDFLFQYCDDPANTEYYGYYYYDSDYHAASYNRSAQRFYVYDYLSSAEGGGSEAFLPLNSPYVNTNGRTVETNTYSGTTHYEYTGGNGVSSEYWFGIQTDIKFYISNKPGEKDSDGNSVNRGVNGEELVFEFSGDDDVWVFVDGKLVLDIGGIHQAVDGSINFSTGEVIVDGRQQNSVTYLEPGEHVLTMYYLERGAGGSNCKVKFNISTRYGLKLQKEDVLTRDLLNGAAFTVFSDKACTNKVNLWKSHADYEEGNPSQSEFVVENGYTSLWGLAAGNTYYIKETKYPDSNSYGVANGIIVIKINSQGTATFDVIPDEAAEGSDLSGGFTVHGYKIDVENHEVNLVATNAKKDYGDEVTSVMVKKKWNDSLDHSKDSVTVYILANGFRIQEAVLNEDNDWTHTWKNLPLKGESEKEVVYTVEEGTVSGYFGTVTEITESTIEKTEITWKQTTSITSGKTYLLKTGSGYLKAENGELSWETNESSAKSSAGTRWVITKANGSNYYFTNELGQKLYYYTYSYNWWNTTRQFRADDNPASNTALAFSSKRLSHSGYYFTGISGGNGTTSNSNALSIELYEEVRTTTNETIELDGKGFLITNEPITAENSVSFKVNKVWNTNGFVSSSEYEQYVVTMKLLENGNDSGMSAQLMLKNGWTYTFTDLPKTDSGGNPINYSIEEVFFSEDWKTEYSDITLSGNQYEVTVTNVYRLHYELPQTGGGGIISNIIGGILALGAGTALIYRTHKKRRKEDTS
ncbi:MAG: Cna B-type domain-containing protein [Oscillospiraceae bacterium]|nr:Cna B-type domain-containing protein [Oscillospiraceae bacterium]